MLEAIAVNHAVLTAKQLSSRIGMRTEPEITSETVTEQTTEDAVSSTNFQIGQAASVHSWGFREHERLSFPLRWKRMT